MKPCTLFLIAVMSVAASSLAQDAGSPTTASTITRTTRESAPPPTTTIYYGGGPVMSGSTNVYVVYYGTWSTTSKNIVNTWLQHIGGSSLYNVNSTYHDSTGAGVQNVVNYNPTTNSYADNYSLGKSLTDASIQTIVSNAIRGAHLPNDQTNGVYFVLTAADVSQSSSNGTLCVNYCGYHSPSTSIMTGETIKYSIVGNFAACPSACDGNIFNGDTTTPNGDIGGDGAVNVMFHELSESVSDPNVTLSNGAWGDLKTGESGDMCNFNFGVFSTLPKAADGAHYDVTISGVNYLIQQMFEVSVSKPVGGTYYPGSCALSFSGVTASVSPTSVNFGQHYYGDPPAYRTVTLTNNGTSSMSITSIGQNLVDPFLISNTTCGSTLGAGLNCNITVEFDTTNAPNGTSSQTMSIVDSATNSPQNVPLTGKMSCPGGQCP
jgi:Phosphate-induced protein 1 conserved region